MVNVPLLEATMRHITDYPELHDQTWYYQQTECGTAMCFAGRACDISGLERTNPLGSTCGFGPGTDARVDTRWGVLSAKGAATLLLDLTRNQSDILFWGGNTRAMLEEMVKDLANTGDINKITHYSHDLVS